MRKAGELRGWNSIEVSNGVICVVLVEINLLSLTVIIEMEFVRRWWSESGESGENGSNGDYTKPPKYNASMDTPRDLPSVGTDESDKEKEKEKQANYSPYTPYTLA